MALTYAQFVTTVANLLALPETDTNFVQILPSAIDYAENRIYRQFSFLNSQVSMETVAPVTTRTFTLPVPTEGPFEIVERLNVLSDGVRTGLTPVSRDVLDMLWPNTTAPADESVPSVFAMQTDQVIVLGPTPSSGVTIEVIGYVNPNPLSASNTTTYLSTTLPDLLVTAAMVFLSGWQKNFGAQSDTPAQAVSWESQYQALAAVVGDMDARQNFEGPSWTSKQPAPFAQPQRG